jgi:adenylate kinase family enzyme
MKIISTILALSPFVYPYDRMEECDSAGQIFVKFPRFVCLLKSVDKFRFRWNLIEV